MMKLLLVEDHPIFRYGTRQLLLQRWPDARVDEAADLKSALDMVCNENWPIAIVDLNLPDANGVEAVTRLIRAGRGLRLLVLSLNDEAAYAERVLQLGAAGYLAKDRASEELIVAIERILAGGRYISPDLAEKLADRMLGAAPAVPHETLSPNEYRVMLQLAAGLRVSDIAHAMLISPKTVSTYRSRILEKLDVAGNVEIARYCLAHGLIKEDT
jgi:DNA-binding NarL/FixJ family response regulator